MYKYKKRFINSTKPSTIFDSNGNEIGVVQKYYKNIFEKIIGNVSFGHFFERYLFKDENDNIIVMAKKTGIQQKKIID
ncbi:tubby C-terminal domain-like protein [Staphylococcus hominis]